MRMVAFSRVTLRLTSAQARRFLVRRHLLFPPRRLPARAESVLACTRHLGGLQFDPLDAPGARNHELVLHARVRGYRRGWCERWLYGADRRLFEVMNKGLSIVPLEELPLHRLSWERARERWHHFLDEQAGDVRHLLDEIAERGALPTGFAARAVGGIVPWWGWGNTTRGRALVEGLFYSGRLGIARREGNARHVDLIERIVPAELLAAPFDTHAAWRHRLLTRVRGLGLLGPGGGEVAIGTGTARDRAALLDELARDGTLLRAEVEGVRGPRYLLAAEEPILRQRGRPAPAVTLLGPLDPLLWDRALLAALWGFEYRWEVYTPPAKRRYGYYVLPILFGDELVGRIEPRVDRAAATLEIRALWLERGFRAGADFARALDEALEAYRTFAGAERITWRARPRGTRRRRRPGS